MHGGRGETVGGRLLLADDHAFMRAGIRAILSMQGGFEVVGEAENGEEAIARCRELRPDLVLMDVSMPIMDGIEATQKIKAQFPMTSVLVLTANDDYKILMSAVKAGAAGYVLKHSNPKHILDAVRAVLSGETPLDQGLAMRLLRHLGEEEAARSSTDAPSAERGAPGLAMASLLNPLTRREAEVLACLAMGKSNRQIAGELHVSLSTVKRHLGLPTGERVE